MKPIDMTDKERKTAQIYMVLTIAIGGLFLVLWLGGII